MAAPTNPFPLPSTTPRHTTPWESQPATEAFLRYLDLGPARSLRKLAEQDVAAGRYTSIRSANRLYARWSTKFRWQERLQQALIERTQEALGEAADLDAQTYLVTSRKLRDLVDAERHTPTTLIAIRGAVKPPASKTSAASVDLSLDLTVDTQVRKLAEKIALEEGIAVDTLLAEVETFVQMRLV